MARFYPAPRDAPIAPLPPVMAPLPGRDLANAGLVSRSRGYFHFIVMFADLRGATADRRTLAVERQRQADEGNFDLGCALHDAERRGLRQRLDLTQVVDRGACYADGIEPCDPMGARMLSHDVGDHRDQHVPVRE